MGYIESPCLIDVKLFDTCLIDGASKLDITQKFPTRKDGAYYLNKFENHLKAFGLTIKEYSIKYLQVNWPKCPISKEDVGYKCVGKGVILSRFKKGRISKEYSENFRRSCLKMSEDRVGAKNPMFNKAPWNAALPEDNEYRRAMREARLGKTASETTRKIQSESAKKRLVHGHTGYQHSEETKRILREKTALGWATGRFSKTTSIHVKVREFLKTLPLTFEVKEEYLVKYFSMDFAFPDIKVAIECQGTFFHIDPRVYPNGPINAIQRRNFGRDKSKKNYCSKIGWTIIEVWETEINDGTFKEELRCRLQKLNLLKG